MTLTAPQVKAYLYSLRQGDKNDENIKRGIINIFLRAVYLYDDRFTLVLNGSDTPVTIDDILLDEIEAGLEGDLTNCEGCSSLVADALLKQSQANQTAIYFVGRYSFWWFCYLNGKKPLQPLKVEVVFCVEKINNNDVNKKISLCKW